MGILRTGESTSYKIKPSDYKFRSTVTGFIVITNKRGQEESYTISDLRAIAMSSTAPQYMRDLAKKALQETGN